MDCSSSDDSSEIIGGVAARKPPKKKKKAPANPDKSVPAVKVAAATASKHPPPKKKKKKKKTKKKNMDTDDEDDDGGGKMPAAQTKITSVSLRIRVKTRFGQCYTRENPPPGSIVGDVKKWLVKNRFIREEHKNVINFIDAQKRILMEDDDTIEYFQGLCELYVVFGTDQKQTGALGVPDLYKPTCKNSFPSVAAASAAGASSTNDGKVEETIPSYFQVSGVFTQEEGYHQNNTCTLSVPKNCQCTYLQTFCVPPQLVDSIRGVEGGGSEFADLLLCVKIGESGSVPDAFRKFMSKRTPVKLETASRHLHRQLAHSSNQSPCNRKTKTSDFQSSPTLTQSHDTRKTERLFGGGIILLSTILSPSPNPFGENDAPHHQSSSEHHKQPGLASQLPINIFSGLGIVWMIVRGTLTISAEWDTIVLVHVCGQPYPKPLLEGGGCNS